VFEKKFESEYIGEVEYTAYTLDRVVFKDGILNPAVLMGTVW